MKGENQFHGDGSTFRFSLCSRISYFLLPLESEQPRSHRHILDWHPACRKAACHRLSFQSLYERVMNKPISDVKSLNLSVSFSRAMPTPGLLE